MQQMYAKLKYKVGMGMIPFLARLWPKRIANRSQSILLNRYIFLVTSTINPSTLTPGRPEARTSFSPQERLDQTLGTIASIRAKVPDPLIVLLDNSSLSPAHCRDLQGAADWLVPFVEDPSASAYANHTNKGVGEVYMLRAMHKVLRSFHYRLLFKLSGRYQLSQHFSLDDFPPDRFGFLSRDGVASTRLYSVPSCLHGLYGRQLAAAFFAARLGVSIENVMACGLSSQEVKWMAPLGVAGHMGNGTWIEE